MRRHDQIVTKTEILDNVWDPAFEGGDNVVEVYIGYLRRKIDVPFGLRTLTTVWGMGYCSAPTRSPGPGRRVPVGDSGSGFSRLAGKDDLETAVAQRVFGGTDGSVVGCHDSGRDGQAQAASAALPGTALVEPDEPLEDPLPVRLRDGVAVVVHGDDAPVPPGSCQG